MKTVLAICGHGGSGKDTIAEWFRDNTTLRYRHSTSKLATTMICNHMWRNNIKKYKTVIDCYNDRANHRELWAKLIDEYNQIDGSGTRLYKDCLEFQDILTGIRKKKEFEACRDQGLFTHSIWVEREGMYDSTQEYRAEDCGEVIENNGTQEELYTKLHAYAEKIGILKP